MKKTIIELRKEIDNADEQILLGLSKRFAAVREIGRIKSEQHLTPLDETRWAEVLHNIITLATKYKIPVNLVKTIYNEIHKTALIVEEFNEQ